MIQTASGGNFEQGFVSGALSSIASSAFQGFGGKFAESGAGRPAPQSLPTLRQNKNKK